MTNTYTKFSQDIGLVALTNIATSVSGLIILPVISKTLGAYGYGIWVQLAIIITLVLSFITLGLPFSLVRFIAAEEDKRKIRGRFYSVTISVLVLSLIACLIIMLLSRIIGDTFFNGNNNLIIIIAIIIPFEGLNTIFFNYFRALRRMKIWSAFNIAEVFGQLGLIIYFVLADYGLIGMVYAMLAVRVVLCLVAAVIIIPKLGLGPPKYSHLKELLRFGIPTIPQNISSWVVQASDRWVISFFLGALFVGYYSPAYALGGFIGILFFPLAFVLPPALSKFYDAGRTDDVKTHLRYSMKYFLMLAIPAFFGLSILSEALLKILSTPEIAANGASITPVVSAGILLLGVYTIFVQIVFMIKKTMITAIIWIIAAAVNLGSNIIIVPVLGIMGAAITTLIAYALVLAITVYYTCRIMTFPVDVLFIVKSLAAAGIMTLVVWLVNPQGALHVFLMILAGAAIYFCILFLLRGFSRGELKFFNSLILLRK
jgi:O-antigen/teichoic acid export membrane protein